MLKEEAEGVKMEDDDEEPPMAIQIQPDVSVRKILSSSDTVSVGVSVITGYLGAGKSTVSPFLSLIYVLGFGF